MRIEGGAGNGRKPGLGRHGHRNHRPNGFPAAYRLERRLAGTVSAFRGPAPRHCDGCHTDCRNAANWPGLDQRERDCQLDRDHHHDSQSIFVIGHDQLVLVRCCCVQCGQFHDGFQRRHPQQHFWHYSQPDLRIRVGSRADDPCQCKRPGFRWHDINRRTSRHLARCFHPWHDGRQLQPGCSGHAQHRSICWRCNIQWQLGGTRRRRRIEQWLADGQWRANQPGGRGPRNDDVRRQWPNECCHFRRTEHHAGQHRSRQYRNPPGNRRHDRHGGSSPAGVVRHARQQQRRHQGQWWKRQPERNRGRRRQHRRHRRLAGWPVPSWAGSDHVGRRREPGGQHRRVGHDVGRLDRHLGW